MLAQSGLRVENRENKARMSMKIKDRLRINDPCPLLIQGGESRLPSSDEEGLGVVRVCDLSALRALA